MRARIRWAEQGESSSSYFFRLEKKNAGDNWCAAIRNDEGQIVSDINQILEAWKSFYSKLFHADPPDLEAQDDVLNHLTMFLSSDKMHLCEGPITVEEALVTLKGMARRKTPGSDGLSAEFFLKFWNVLGSDLVQVLNTSHEYGTLPSSMRKSLITLLFKKGHRLDIKNWRSISLLNIDYKLCARVLAGRLLKVIHLVVHRDQSCGVPGDT